MKRILFTSVLFSIGVVSAASASTAFVANFGDHGWYSDDTRSNTGADLVGVNNTAYGKPGQTPTLADDAAIALQITPENVGAAPAGSVNGAWAIDGTNNNAGKSNIATVNTSGFADASDLTLPTFNVTYRWYAQKNPTSRTLAFKLGIQSVNWGTGVGQSQETFTATRSGESVWDLVLVHVATSVADNAWNTVSEPDGLWSLYAQAGNSYYTAPSGVSKSLADWANDATWAPILFGAGAKVTSVQLGLGSYQRDNIAHLDWLQTSVLNGGDRIDFIPEPASLMLLGLGGLMSLKRRR